MIKLFNILWVRLIVSSDPEHYLDSVLSKVFLSKRMVFSYYWHCFRCSLFDIITIVIVVHSLECLYKYVVRFRKLVIYLAQNMKICCGRFLAAKCHFQMNKTKQQKPQPKSNNNNYQTDRKTIFYMKYFFSSQIHLMNCLVATVIVWFLPRIQLLFIRFERSFFSPIAYHAVWPSLNFALCVSISLSLFSPSLPVLLWLMFMILLLVCIYTYIYEMVIMQFVWIFPFVFNLFIFFWHHFGWSKYNWCYSILQKYTHTNTQFNWI